MIEASKKKQLAMEALHKLLDRQQRDVMQTLDLLHSLEVEYENFEKGQWSDWSGESGEINNNVTAVATSSSTSSTSTISNDGIANTTSPPSQIIINPSSSIAASVAAGADYGYISRSEGCRFEITTNRKEVGNDARFRDYGPPGNIFELGSQQFMRNLRAMIGEYNDNDYDDGKEKGNDSTTKTSLTDRQRYLQAQLQELTLDTKRIWEREHLRGPIVAPYIIKIPYFALCYFLDVVFEGKNPFCRFFMLETVARMPYFSYITMLHLYETLGFWRRSADVKRIHFAEEWNEVREERKFPPPLVYLAQPSTLILFYHYTNKLFFSSIITCSSWKVSGETNPTGYDSWLNTQRLRIIWPFASCG